jgi:hypothetical protein
VIEFIQGIKPRKVAVFCTYYGMLGATLIDMEAALRQVGPTFVAGLDLRVGTEQYRFRRDVSQYVEQITETHLLKSRQFARRCGLGTTEPVDLRLRGICGKDCTMCSKCQRRQCAGAAIGCWSGSNCEVFECCVIKKTLAGCITCKKGASCSKRSSVLTGESG